MADTKKTGRIVVSSVLAGIVLTTTAFVLYNNRNMIPLTNVEANADHDAVEGINGKFTDRTKGIGDRYRQGDPNARRDLIIAKLQRQSEVEGVQNPNIKLCEGKEVPAASAPTEQAKLMDQGDILWHISEGCKVGQLVGVFYTVKPTTRDVFLITVEGGVLPDVPELTPATARDKANSPSHDETYDLDGWVDLKIDRPFERGVYVLYKKK